MADECKNITISDISQELQKITNSNGSCPIASLTVEVCNNDDLNGIYKYIGKPTEENEFFVNYFYYSLQEQQPQGCAQTFVEDLEAAVVGNEFNNNLYFYNQATNLTLIIYEGLPQGEPLPITPDYDIVDTCNGVSKLDTEVSPETGTIFNKFVINIANDISGDINVLKLVSEIEKVSNLCNGICPEPNQSILNIEVDAYYNNNPNYLNKNFDGKYNYIGKQTGPGNDMYDYIYEKYGNICGDQVQLQNLRQLKSQNQTNKKKRNITDNIVKESNENGAEAPDVPNESYWFYNDDNNAILQIYITNTDPAAYNYYEGYVFYDLCSYNEILVDDNLSYLCNLEERYGENEKTIFNKFDYVTVTPCDINKTQLYDVLLPIYSDNDSINGRVLDSMDKICINVCNEFSIDEKGDSYKYDGEYTLIGVYTNQEGYNDLAEYLDELCGNSFCCKKFKKQTRHRYLREFNIL